MKARSKLLLIRLFQVAAATTEAGVAQTAVLAVCGSFFQTGKPRTSKTEVRATPTRTNGLAARGAIFHYIIPPMAATDHLTTEAQRGQ
jgi:hypothetical protein